MSAGSGVRGCPYTMIFSKNEARVDLNLARAEASENKWLFDQLLIMKDQIETKFGAPLVWRRMDTKKASRIIFAKPFDGYNRESWPEMIDWLSVHTRKFEAAFAEPLAKLNPKLRTLESEVA